MTNCAPEKSPVAALGLPAIRRSAPGVPARPGLTDHPTPASTLEQNATALVEQLEIKALTPLPEDAGPAFPRSRALLALLIQSYARGIYKSSVVAESLRRETPCRQRLGETLPDAHVIRRFRSANRKLLRRGLNEALKFTDQPTISLGFSTQENNAQLARETSRRIIMAMFLDNMELEGGVHQ